MCMGMRSGPPYGIPIPREIHELYSDELKQAWVTFDAWWKEASSETEGPISRSSMPEEVKQAMHLILDTAIPEHEGATGRDSCYMTGVQSRMID